jgi:polysaccharide biosynthesis protein PslH
VKIVVLTSRFPYPLEKGDKLRIYYQMRELVARGHKIVLITLAENEVQSADFQQVKQFCSAVHVFKLSKFSIFLNILRNILRGGKMPFQVAYFYNQSIKKQIQQLIEAETPDHIYCHLARMAAYVVDEKHPKTLDYMDAFGAGSERQEAVAKWWLRPMWRMETRRMLDFERFLFEKFNNTTIIAEQDRAWLPLSHEQQNRVVVVPNGVDTGFFDRKNAFDTEGGIFEEKKQGETGNDSKFRKPSRFPKLIQHSSNSYFDLCFVGNLGYYSNVSAVQFLVHNILPELKKHRPHISVLLAGARPSAEIQNLADDNVTVKGWFDDIRVAYMDSKIMVAPLFQGTGQQNKILEAMALGVPVVTTTRVNNAIGATPDVHILLADTEGAFVEQIIRILEDVDFRLRLAEQARDFVVINYSWAASVDILEKHIGT